MKKRFIAIAALTLIASPALVSCSSADQGKSQFIKTTSTKEAAPPKPHKAPIEDYATRPYTAAGGWTKTIATYGPRLNELQAYRVKAANVASLNASCDKVISSEISTMRGGLNDMHFFVDCENGTRFRFSESELNAANVTAVSEADKAVSEAAAAEHCRGAVMKAASHPSTVKFNNWAGSSYRMIPQTGAASVVLPFTAKNSFGLELSFTARCLYQSDGSSEVNIEERKS